jgi:CHASE1-domain containing sensor protein
MITVLKVAAALVITAVAVSAITAAGCLAVLWLGHRRATAAQAADEQACALTRPDDDTAYLASVEADLVRSRAVRRLARRLEITR